MNKTKIIKGKLLELQPLVNDQCSDLYTMTVSDYEGNLIFSAVYPDFKAANKALHAAYKKISDNSIEDIEEIYGS